MSRKNWNLYFIEMAALVAERSTCLSRQTGALIVDFKNRIISQGYNGTPRGMLHCDEGGCARCLLIERGKLTSGERISECVEVHAEINCIIQAAQTGRLPPSFKLYTLTFPCVSCFVALVNAGCKEMLFLC